MAIEHRQGLPPQLRPAELLGAFLVELGALAVEQAARAAQRRGAGSRPRRGSTLRPGEDTPLWAAVAAKVRPHLRARGAKAGIARVLGVPRQRVHDYFVSGTKMPDAERMMMILFWLASREDAAGAAPKPAR